MEGSQKNTHVRSALLVSLVMVGIHIWIHVKGQGLNPALLLAATLPMIVGIIFNVYQHASVNRGAGFGTYFNYGLRFTAVVTVVMVLFAVIFFKAMPQYKDQLLETLQRSVDRKSSGLDDEAIMRSIKDWDDHFLQRLVTIYIFLHMVPGALASVIGALVASRKTQTA